MRVETAESHLFSRLLGPRGLLLAAAVSVGALAAAFIFPGFVLRSAQLTGLFPEGVEARAERIRALPPGKLVLTGVEIEWPEGRFRADTVRSGLRLGFKGLRLSYLELLRPAISLEPSDSGPGGGRGGLPSLSVDRFRIDDGIVEGLRLGLSGEAPTRWAFEDLHSNGSELVLGLSPSWVLDTLHFRARVSNVETPVTVRARSELGVEGIRVSVDLHSERSDISLEGVGRWNGDLRAALRTMEGTVRAPRLDLADLAPFFPWDLPAGHLSADLDIEGPTGQVDGSAVADLGNRGRGTFDGRMVLPEGGPVQVDLTGSLHEVDSRVLGLPEGGAISAELTMDLAGTSWEVVSGRVGGQVASTSPGVGGRIDLEASEGLVSGFASLAWEERKIALDGGISLDDASRPWHLNADVQGPEESIQLQSHGSSLSGSFAASGTLWASGLAGVGSFAWEDAARVEINLTELPGPADSAVVAFGAQDAGELTARAFQGAGQLDLHANWANGRLAVRRLDASDWPLTAEDPGVISGRARGWVSRPASGWEGLLSVALDGVKGGRLGGTTGTAEVALIGEGAEISGTLEQKENLADFSGSVMWGGGGNRVTLNRLAANWGGRGQSATRLVWAGSLGLSSTEWDGSGRLAVHRGIGPGPGWDLQMELGAMAGDLQVTGAGQGRLDGLWLEGRVVGGWERAGPLWLHAMTDSLELPVGADPRSWLSGAATLELPRWSQGLASAQLTTDARGAWGELAVDSLHLGARFLEPGELELAGRLRSDGLTGTMEGIARMVGGGMALRSARLEGSVSRPEALLEATQGRLVGQGKGVLEFRRAGEASLLQGDLTLAGPQGFGMVASRASLELNGSWGEMGLQGRATAQIQGISAGDHSPEDLNLALQAEADSLLLRGTLGTKLGIMLGGDSSPGEILLKRGELKIGPEMLYLARPSILDLWSRERRLEELTFTGADGASSLLMFTAAAPGDEPWRIQLRVQDLPAGPILEWVPYGIPTLEHPLLTGTGAFQGGGGPDGATGNATVALSGLLESGDPFRVEAEARTDSEWAAFSANARVRDRWARVEAALPREGSEGRLRLEVEAEDFPLTPFMGGYGAAGTVQGARMSGRLVRRGDEEGGDLEGELRMTVGSWEFVSADQAFQDIDLYLRGDGPFVQVDGSARSNEGSASLTGTVNLLDGPTPALDLLVNTDRFSLAWSSSFSLQTAGQLRLSGSLTEPRVTGSVRLEGSELLLGSQMAVEPVDLTDDDRALLRERFGWRDARSSTSSWLPLEALSADVRIEAGGDVWIRRWADPELAVALLGSLDLRKTPGEDIQIFGSLAPIPRVSSFRQFGRRFSVTSGSIELLGPLDGVDFTLSGEHEVASRTDPGSPEAVITMTVQGSPRDLSVLLESDPSMDQADIVSYLLLGQPSGSLAAQNRSSAAEAGAGIALSRLSAVLGEAGSEAIGLDVVDLEPRAMGGVTLVAGRYLSPRLFVAIRQPVAWHSQAGTNPTGSERLPALEAELRAARWLLLNLAGDAEGFALVLRSRWGY